MAISCRVPGGLSAVAESGSNTGAPLSQTVTIESADPVAAGDLLLVWGSSEGASTGGTHTCPDPIQVGNINFDENGGLHPASHTVSNVTDSGTNPDLSSNADSRWMDFGYAAGGYTSGDTTGIGRNQGGVWVKVLTAADILAGDPKVSVTLTVDRRRRMQTRLMVISGASIIDDDLASMINIATSTMGVRRGTSGGTYPEVIWLGPDNTSGGSGSPSNQIFDSTQTITSNTTLAFAAAGVSDATITASTGTPFTGFVDGKVISVTGSEATPTNNGLYRITGPSTPSDTISIVPVARNVVTAESAGPSITIKSGGYTSADMGDDFLPMWHHTQPSTPLPNPAAAVTETGAVRPSNTVGGTAGDWNDGSEAATGSGPGNLYPAGFADGSGGGTTGNHGYSWYWEVPDLPTADGFFGWDTFATFHQNWDGATGHFRWDMTTNSPYPWCSQFLMFKTAVSAVAHTRSFTDDAEALDTSVLGIGLVFADPSEVLDTKTFTEDVIAHTFSETDTTETLDTCVLNIDYSFTDSAEAEDTRTFDLVEAHVLSVTDTTETLDTSVLNIDYRFTDPSEAEDTKTFDSTAANTFSETDPAETLDTCVLNINYSFTDTSGSEDTLALDLGLVITDPAEAEDTGTFETGTPHTRSFTDTADEGPAGVSTITWGLTLFQLGGPAGSYFRFDQLDQNFGRLDNSILTIDSTEAEDTGTFDETGINVFSKTDTLSTDDTLTLDISHSFTDTAEALDTKTFTEDATANTRSFTDTSEVLDTRTFTEDVTAHTRSFTDTTEALDTKTFTEDVTAHTRSFTDTAEAPDTCVLNIAYSFTDTSEVLDTKTFDHTSVAVGETRSFTDTSEVLDTKTFTEDVVVYTRSFTDTAETLDTKTFTEDVIVYTRSFTDTATSDDTIVLNIDYSFTDTLEVEDTLTPVEDVDAFTETRTDTSEVLDSYVPGYGREPVETSGISDSLTLNLSIVIEDTSTVEDELSIVRAVNFSVTDTGEALDTLTAAHVYEDVLEAIDTLTTLLTIGLTSEIIGKGTITGQSPPELLTEGEALALIDIYNTSLNALGVGTLSATTDTSPQATILNNVWPSFRKQFLADYSWNGAKKSVVLSRLQDYTDTDVTPAGDRWSFAYVLPTDYLRVLRINGYERYNKTQRMLQNAFEIEVVNYADSVSTTEDKRCLLTDEAGAINLEYIFDPGNDGIDLLGSKTTHALGLSLAHYVARNFGKTPQEIQVLADESRRAVSAAKGVDGQEKTQRLRSDMGLLESRYWWVG